MCAVEEIKAVQAAARERRRLKAEADVRASTESVGSSSSSIHNDNNSNMLRSSVQSAEEDSVLRASVTSMAATRGTRSSAFSYGGYDDAEEDDDDRVCGVVSQMPAQQCFHRSNSSSIVSQTNDGEADVTEAQIEIGVLDDVSEDSERSW